MFSPQSQEFTLELLLWNNPDHNSQNIEKVVPDELKQLSVEQLSVFMEAFTAIVHFKCASVLFKQSSVVKTETF